MRFYKMHGTGNDFIVLENLDEKNYDYSSLAKSYCNRHMGIGADGILVILPSKKADFRMRIFNANGSEAEMCGNGIRCFSRYVYDKKLTPKKKFKVETLSGILEPECIIHNEEVERIRVNLGNVRYGDLHSRAGQPLNLQADRLSVKLELSSGIVEGASVSMGNPHYVVFRKTNLGWNLEEHGKAISTHPKHPHQSNVEFVEITGEDSLRVDVWERGAGPTQACGSGACATAAAARILFNMPEKLKVKMPGGILDVEWSGEGNIFLTGPAVYVYQGEISELPESTSTLRQR